MERLRQPPPLEQTTSDVSEVSPEAVSEVPELGQDPGVEVISGASIQSLPLAGLRVSQARELSGSILNIDPESPVLVNGEPALPEQRLKSRDVLEFVHHAGEKG